MRKLANRAAAALAVLVCAGPGAVGFVAEGTDTAGTKVLAVQ